MTADERRASARLLLDGVAARVRPALAELIVSPHLDDESRALAGKLRAVFDELVAAIETEEGLDETVSRTFDTVTSRTLQEPERPFTPKPKNEFEGALYRP